MKELDQLEAQVIRCRQCPRLVAWREEVARVKVRRFRHETYWGNPIPGFGDHRAKLIIVGLAPGAHGANRTGRVFTGDSSGDWLFKALHETGFANQAESTASNDGLKLCDAFITAAARCAPPANKVVAEELRNCRPYLEREVELIKSARVYLALGAVAYKTLQQVLRFRDPAFGHGVGKALDAHRWVLASYHPSRQNTQTGRLTWEAWIEIFRRARQLIA